MSPWYNLSKAVVALVLHRLGDVPAPVAQRIELWPPEPGAWVRVPPGALDQTLEPAGLVYDVSQGPTFVEPAAVVQEKLRPPLVQIWA